MIERSADCLWLDWRKEMAMFHQGGKEACGGFACLPAPNNFGSLLGWCSGELFGQPGDTLGTVWQGAAEMSCFGKVLIKPFE